MSFESIYELNYFIVIFQSVSYKFSQSLMENLFQKSMDEMSFQLCKGIFPRGSLACSYARNDWAWKVVLKAQEFVCIIQTCCDFPGTM